MANKTTNSPPVGIETLQDIELERTALSMILNGSIDTAQAIRVLSGQSAFSDSNNARIFNACETVHRRNKKVKPFEVIAELQLNDKEISWIDLVTEIKDSGTASGMLPQVCLTLTHIAARRSIFEIAGEVSRRVRNQYNDVPELIADLKSGIERIEGGLYSMLQKEFKDEVSDWVKTKEEIAKGQREPGLYTGFVNLDSLLRGLRPGQLVIIAARPSAGKTALATHTTLNVAHMGFPVGFLSLEMESGELIERFFGNEAEIHSAFMVKPTEREIERIKTFQNRIAELPIHLHDRAGMTISEVEAKAYEWVSEKKIKLLIVDYIQLIESDRPMSNTTEKVKQSSTRLKNLAKKLKIPVIALAQMSRGVDTQNRPPELSDLKESGQIEQDADVVMFLRKPSEEEIAGGVKLENEIEVHVRKHRGGSQTPRDKPIPLTFIGKFYKFMDQGVQLNNF